MVVRELITMLGFKVEDKKLKAFESSVDSFKKSLFDLQNVVAAGLAATMWGLVQGAREYGDELEATSIKMGIASSELQRLRYVALQTDVEVGSLQNSMMYMSRVVGQAGLGSKQAGKALNDLGISAKDAASLTPVQLFQKMVTQLSSMEDKNKRNAMAMKVFGRGYRELIPMLETSPEKIAAVVKQMNILGFQTDKATETQAAFDDTMNMLETSWKNVLLTVGTALIPVVQFFAKMLTALLYVFHLLPGPVKAVISVLTTLAFIIPALAIASVLFSKALKVVAFGLKMTAVEGRTATMVMLQFGKAMLKAFKQIMIAMAVFYSLITIFDDIAWFVKSKFAMGAKAPSMIGRIAFYLIKGVQWLSNLLYDLANTIQSYWDNLIDGIIKKIPILKGALEGLKGERSQTIKALNNYAPVLGSVTPAGGAGSGTEGIAVAMTGATVTIQVNGAQDPKATGEAVKEVLLSWVSTEANKLIAVSGYGPQLVESVG